MSIGRANLRLALAGSVAALAIASPGVALAQSTTTDATQSAPQNTDPADISTPSNADGTSPDSGDVVVTGSRIKRPNFETLQPSVVVDSKQIEARGFETLGQALNEQPTFGVPGASPVGGQAGSFGSGQSFVNFLGLGDQRTLVLVNGRRFVSSNTASIFGPSSAGSQVDLNGINTELVDRVETIAIGGAPIYGSDAIAGTVNIILKHDYEGFKLDGQYGIADRGDAPNYRIRGIAGRNFLDDRLNVTVSGEYNQSKGLVYNDRKLTAAGRFYGDCPPGSTFTQCLYNDRRIPSISESGIPLVGGAVLGLDFPITPAQSDALLGGSGLDYAGPFNPGVLNGAGQYLQFDPSGNLIPLDFGQAVGGPNDFNVDFSGGNGFNLFNTQQLLTDTKRYNANILTSFQVTNKIRIYGEGWYSYSRATNLREQPVYNSALFDAAGTPDGNIILSINNPFLTPAQRAIIQSSIDNNPYSDQNYLPALGVSDPFTQDYFYYGRANTDLTTGRATSSTEVYRFVAGLEGSFHGPTGSDWNFEVVGTYGHAHGKGREPVLVEQNFENAVGAITAANPTGTPCLAGLENAGIGTLNSTCTPLNIFGNGVLSEAARDYVTAIADPSSNNSQWVVTASLSGGLFKLPGGDFSFALGYEHRREATSFRPGAFYYGADDPDPTVDTSGDGIPDNDRVQYGRSIPIFPVSGSFHTNEFFGELRAPIVSPSNGIGGIYSLELHGAARHVQHSVAGGDWTWTGEGRYAPIRDFAVRGNYTRSIRAPAITEIFNPSSQFFGFADDPCDADNRTVGPDPATRQANCTAAGIPADFQSLSAQRSFHQTLIGNPTLKNERSSAWSVGAVLTPRFIPGFTASADWLDIRLRDAITSFSGTQVVDACYDSADYPNNDFCPLITRDADGQLSFIATRYFNAAEYRYKGLIGALDYRTNTPFLGPDSSVGLNVSYQYLKSLTQKADANSAPTHLSGSIGYPHQSAVVNLSYDNGPFSIYTSVNYTGPVDQDSDEPKGYREFQHLDGVAFVNGGFAFTVDKRMTFRVVVDNIFDKKPPYPVPAFGGSVSYFPGILGRYFRFGTSLGF